LNIKLLNDIIEDALPYKLLPNLQKKIFFYRILVLVTENLGKALILFNQLIPHKLNDYSHSTVGRDLSRIGQNNLFKDIFVPPLRKIILLSLRFSIQNMRF
jgi:hypothetical protein